MIFNNNNFKKLDASPTNNSNSSSKLFVLFARLLLVSLSVYLVFI